LNSLSKLLHNLLFLLCDYSHLLWGQTHREARETFVLGANSRVEVAEWALRALTGLRVGLSLAVRRLGFADEVLTVGIAHEDALLPHSHLSCLLLEVLASGEA